MCQLVHVLLHTYENEYFPICSHLLHYIWPSCIFSVKQQTKYVCYKLFWIFCYNIFFLHMLITPTRIFKNSLTVLWESLLSFVLNAILAMGLLGQYSENSWKLLIFAYDRVSLLVHSCNAVSNLLWPNVGSGFSISHFFYHMKCDYWFRILFFQFPLLFNMPVMSHHPLPLPKPQISHGLPQHCWLE